MADFDHIWSRPYKPDFCCPKCAFNEGEHAEFCEKYECPSQSEKNPESERTN